MPLNEIEQHPFLNYFSVRLAHSSLEHYTKLIIGSFPVYELTNTVFPIANLDERWSKQDIKMPFFYGSQTNSFWRRLALAFGERDPQNESSATLRKQTAVDILENNHILLTDIISQTNRHLVSKGITNGYSPADQALFNKKAEPEVRSRFQLNTDIITWLKKAKNIRSIYFTAQKNLTGKNPGGWFHQLLSDAGVQYRLLSNLPNALRYEVQLDQPRELTLFFLPTPSGKRSIALTALRQHPMFDKYLMNAWPGYQQHISNDYPLQEKLIAKYRECFIQDWWTAFLAMERPDFDGAQIEELL